MSTITQLLPQIYYVGVNDRSKHRFEGLWPLPLGVSYNSYLIVDEKVALIDTVDLCYADRFLIDIREKLGEKTIDYLVINHMEPDHSASIGLIKKYYPNIEIIGNKKTFGMIDGFYGICDGFKEVKEGDTLSLGKNTLQFYMTPMVHWPETMMSYLVEQKALFSGDAFGCFGALDGGIVDEEMNTDKFWSEMYRYYSNIVGKYGSPVQKALGKFTNVEISMICSTHGPVWKKERAKVIDIYDKLSRYEGENGVVIAYGSMYGNTEALAEVIAKELAAQGIKNIVMHNLTKSHLSYVLSDIFKYKGLIIGSPTYTNHLFPEVESLISKIESRDLKGRTFAYFGSFAWAGAAVKELTAFAERMKWEINIPPVEMKQGLKNDKIEEAKQLARNFAKQLK